MFPAQIDEPPATYLNGIGEVFALFDAQDSGNVSYGVTIDNHRYFVKTAGDPEDPKPFSPTEARHRILRNAARLAEDVEHELLPQYHGLIESPEGPVLVYDWREGEHVRSTLDRFGTLPVEEIVAALDQLYDLHDVLSAAGWVAGDFYDGSLLYDFDTQQLTTIDLDDYHLGAFHNNMGRMFGSSRFMAPEELALGALIDDRTTAYVMARTAFIFLGENSDFRGTKAQHAVLQEATSTRYPDYQTFYAAWLASSTM